MQKIIKQLSIKIIIVFLILSILSNIVSSGNLLNYQKRNLPTSIHKEGCCEGYTLLNILYFGTVLIDMDGKIIHRWRSVVPHPAKFLPGGTVITGDGFKVYSLACADINILREIDWNGSINWQYNNWENQRARQHHDFEREGNPVGYYAPGQDFVDQGKTLVLAHKNIINTSISKKPLLDEIIYEIDYNGSLTGFEWHASDHFDQFGFDNKTKHGIYVSPGMLGDGDWLHMNSMSNLGKNPWYSKDPINYSSFKPENIIVCLRNINSIAIIDRQTGDIVWMIGPDYSNNTEYGQKLGQLIGLHNAHMIPKGLPGEGNILVFDNGGTAGYGYYGMPNLFRLWSRVIEFDPVTFEIIWQYSNIKLNWWIPRTGENHRFFSYYISSAQRLPNGNTLITEGANGRVIELTNNSEIVWEYKTHTRLSQLYRSYRIPPEWVPGNPSGYAFWENS